MSTMTEADTAPRARSRPHSRIAQTGADERCCRSSAATIPSSRRPTGRAASRCEGFDDIYTDIVDYIVRCTHKIWDERDIGLIYTHYTHNCVLYGTMGTIYNREDVVRDTIQRLVSLPRAARHGHPGDLERQRQGRLLHLATSSPARAATPSSAISASRPAGPSSRAPSPTA